jgi:catechol 2,3-dioxygenase-like lactoylglutathione lyase family enzyme
MSNQSNSVCEAKTFNHIAISVSDLARSKDWYCQIFGLRPIQESAESVLLGFGESMIVLRAEGTPGIISHCRDRRLRRRRVAGQAGGRWIGAAEGLRQFPRS